MAGRAADESDAGSASRLARAGPGEFLSQSPDRKEQLFRKGATRPRATSHTPGGEFLYRLAARK